MKDKGREETDRKLKELEKEIGKIYNQANSELIKKMEKYFSDFKRKDDAKKKELDDGKITDYDYTQWRINQLAVGQRWIDMCGKIAEDMHNVNKIARNVTNGHMPEVYAINHNWATYDAEHKSEVSTNYTLYNPETVERLMQEDPDILPLASKGLNSVKDVEWNRKVINSVMLQGILQGESIRNMARRFESVGVSNYKASVRYARTATTGSENAGRIDGYHRAEKLGINIKKVWLATLDDRTRDSHRYLDGEERKIDEKFSNGCKHPGDPNGPPSEVWNCRCTLITQIGKQNYDVSTMPRNSKLHDMSYEEWKNELSHSESEPKSEAKVEKEPEIEFIPAKSIKEAEKYAVDKKIAKVAKLGNMDIDRANVVNQTLERLRKKYPTKTLDSLEYNGRLKTANAKANFSYIIVGPHHEDNGYWENREKYLNEYNELIKKYKNVREAQTYVKRLKKAVKELEEELKYERWSVSSVHGLDATITHEYGHVIADQYFGQINGLRAKSNYFEESVQEQNEYIHGVYKKAKGNGDIYKISCYASTDEAEFFAETFAMYDKNEKLPDYIREMIEVILKDGIL